MSVPAVRLYPGGGLICQSVQRHEVMSMSQAIKALRNGEPACISIDHLFAIRCIWQVIQEQRRNEIEKEILKRMRASSSEYIRMGRIRRNRRQGFALRGLYETRNGA